MRKSLAFPALLLLASPAVADIKEWETVFEQGSWRLDVNIWDDDSLSCESRTVNDDGIVMRYESWPDGAVTLTLYNETWQFPTEGVSETYNLRIDESDPWEVTGDKYDSSVSSILDPSEDGVISLLDAMVNGSAVQIESKKGTAITQFALTGFGATLEHHIECEARIIGASPSQQEDSAARRAKETF